MKSIITSDKTNKLTLGVTDTVLMFALPIAVAILSVCIGRIVIPLKDALNAVFSPESVSKTYLTVLKLRLPRIVLAALAGAGLSVSGAVFQSLFVNPLATPDTVGVASGASFGAALGLLLGFGMTGVSVMSMFFGMLAVVLTYIIGKSDRENMNSVVLSGIMIGSLFTALVSLVKFTADSETELPSITYFLMGSLSNASWRGIITGGIFIVPGIIILLLLRWRLNLLMLSTDEALTSGVNIKKLRITAAILATVITAACISMCGQVGWIGLIVPHMCRMIYKNNFMRLLPSVISIGAVFMMIVDTLARSVTAAEIPVSVITAIVGAPFFILLMKRNGGWRL